MEAWEETGFSLKGEDCAAGYPESILSLPSSMFRSETQFFIILANFIMILWTYFPCGFTGFFVDPPVFLLAFLIADSNPLVVESRFFVFKVKIILYLHF